MAFPRKFQPLLDIELSDVDRPDYAWLVYAVCACSKDACGWGGWMIDAVCQISSESRATTGRDKYLDAVTLQTCPNCGRDLFRTNAELRFEPSIDQTSLEPIPGVDYEVMPMEFEDE